MPEPNRPAAGHRPIFVIGVNRSGTTLLSLMLDAHSRVAIPYESHFFVKYYADEDLVGDLGCEAGRRALVDRILAEPYVRRWDYHPDPGEIDLDACGDLATAIAQVYSAYARHFGKDLWGDKTPSYISELHVMNRMFPDAKFVHVIRDGRDVALSVLRQRWGANDFAAALRDWVREVTCARKMLAMLPVDRFLELKFEDLVSDAPCQLRRVADFLGLNFEEGMVSGYMRRASDKVGDRINEHHANLLGAPSADQAYKWRSSLGPADQAVAFEIAGQTFVELGYPPGVREHPLRLARKAYHRLRGSYEWRRHRRNQGADREVP